ncbi:transcriptional regulator [Thermoleophilia bacterium SCSIO 60948]|nr:transcriptional regulator [Thermoleophilia bacterium SCSIO 60948]
MTITAGNRLRIDAAEFRRHFAHDSMAVRHSLLDDPRMSLDSLGELADRHPSERIEQNRGAISEVAAADAAERSDLSPGEIARTIETNGLWMVIKNIELDPRYKALLDELLDEVEPIVAGAEGGMKQREGFIFLSAPNATTPSHTDPEHNFLLQVRGLKHMVVGKFPDERTRQLEIENKSSGGHRNIDWKPVDPIDYEMSPGDGVYVPPHEPHLVRNGPEASVSLSITFRTPATERVARASSINARLRRMHLSPKPPGERPQVDRMKAEASRVLGRLRNR